MGAKIKGKHAKPRILFMGEDVALSHVVRPLTLAQDIKGSYEVFFAAGQKQAELIKSSGIEYHAVWTLSADAFVERYQGVTDVNIIGPYWFLFRGYHGQNGMALGIKVDFAQNKSRSPL